VVPALGSHLAVNLPLRRRRRVDLRVFGGGLALERPQRPLDRRQLTLGPLELLDADPLVLFLMGGGGEGVRG